MKNNNAKSIKIIIADDHALFRAGVRTTLSNHKNIEIVGEATNGLQLLHLLSSVKPDIILLDIQMPLMNGYETLAEVKKLYPAIKVIILSMYNDHSMIISMLQLGANSFLPKESDLETIYEAIESCYQGLNYFNHLTSKAMITGLRMKKIDHTNHGADKNSRLVEKIKQVIQKIIDTEDGLTKTNSSDYLSRSLNYSYTHLSKIFSEAEGVTIEQYLIALKIDRVKELLNQDDLNLTQISYKLNYSSVAHLSNQFKKITGSTPTLFKKTLSDLRKATLRF